MTELFHFLLADRIIVEMYTANTIIVTKEELTLSNQIILDHVTPCSHEEVDTRIFVHARHAATEGNKVLMINANDIARCCI